MFLPLDVVISKYLHLVTQIMNWLFKASLRHMDPSFSCKIQILLHAILYLKIVITDRISSGNVFTKPVGLACGVDLKLVYALFYFTVTLIRYILLFPYVLGF